MPDQPDRPQIYLVTPAAFAPEVFAPRLAAVLDAHPVACLRLALATPDEAAILHAADRLREIAHARDVPLVIDSHFRLVRQLGLDGVHLPDGARNLRTARKALGTEAIIGAFCGASQHAGLNSGEAGADYVAFGPVAGSALGSGAVAGRDLFEWWSEMIELPVVAEGGLTPALVEALAPVTDFFAFGPEIWGAEDAAQMLAQLVAPIA